MISRELDDGQLLTVDEVAEWLRLEKPLRLPASQVRRAHSASTSAGTCGFRRGAVRAYIMANMVEAEEPKSKTRVAAVALVPGLVNISGW